MEGIAAKYGLDLNGAWNKKYLPHKGRHPNEYHEFVYNKMIQATNEAGLDKDKFLTLYKKYVIDPVTKNPALLTKKGWGR